MLSYFRERLHLSSRGYWPKRRERFSLSFEERAGVRTDNPPFCLPQATAPRIHALFLNGWVGNPSIFMCFRPELKI